MSYVVCSLLISLTGSDDLQSLDLVAYDLRPMKAIPTSVHILLHTALHHSPLHHSPLHTLQAKAVKGQELKELKLSYKIGARLFRAAAATNGRRLFRAAAAEK